MLESRITLLWNELSKELFIFVKGVTLYLIKLLYHQLDQ